MVILITLNVLNLLRYLYLFNVVFILFTGL